MLERVFVKPDVTSQRLFVSTCTCRGYGLFQALIWLGGHYGESTSSFGRANVLSLRRTRPPRAARLPPEPAKREARKRRANERPRVACCEELAGLCLKQL